MSRPLSMLLAAAIAVSPVALGTTAAFAGDNRSGEWHSDRGGWDGDRRWGHHRRHDGANFSFGAPGFSFSFGNPYPPRYSYYRPRPARDCYQNWDGSVFCRAY